MIQELVFITGNAKKAEQLGYHLDFPVMHQKLDLEEIQSVSLEEVITHKVKLAYEQVHKPVLVEDTGLIFKAMGRLPGPFIKFFLQELKNDGLCHLANSYSNNSALAQVLFGFFDGKKVHFFDGEIEGTISDVPRGEQGFGWDPIFIPKGHSKTWGEMDMEEQKETSMRRIALKKLEAFLLKHQGTE